MLVKGKHDARIYIIHLSFRKKGQNNINLLGILAILTFYGGKASPPASNDLKTKDLLVRTIVHFTAFPKLLFLSLSPHKSILCVTNAFMN